jgi:hypothetical protein
MTEITKHRILLDVEWTKYGDADDIIEYYTKDANRNKLYELLIIPDTELVAMNHVHFFSGTVFGQSDTIQHQLRKYNYVSAEQIIPDTYDTAFKDFYRREIEIITLAELRYNYLSQHPSSARFIKPIGNSKSFDGQVIYDCNDLDDLLAKSTDLTYETTVYSCPPLDIQGEIRLLIGAGRLYGSGQISVNGPPNNDYLIPGSDGNSDGSAGFLDKLIAASDRFLCVDIGWVPQLGCWIVVEINPPFALDEYDIPIADYLKFTEDTFMWIRGQLTADTYNSMWTVND